jgi:hypothetical protein
MSRSFNFYPLVTSIISNFLESRSETATVYSLDGNRANIRIGNSPSLIRSVSIVGDPSLVKVGSKVTIIWVDDRPMILAGGMGEITSPTNSGVIVDNETIERGYDGIRVKQGGIDLRHLSFSPALTGHTHKDSLQRGGWVVMDNGTLYNNRTYLSPEGTITLGESPQIVRLSSVDGTYRIWAGSVQGENATFSVDKYGNIVATAGEVGGWTLDDDSISADSGNAELNASTPHIQLGGRTYSTGSGLWVGKDVDSIYKLILGDSSHYLRWNGSTLEVAGEISADTGEIGGWSIAATSLSSGDLVLDSANPSIEVGRTGYNVEGEEGFWVGFDGGIVKMMIGDADNFISWDGDSLAVAANLSSANYVSGLSGWNLDPTGDAEFRDVKVRGSIKSSIVEYGQVLAIDGGFIAAKSSGLVETDFTAVVTNFDIDVQIAEGASSSDLPNYWAADDVLRVKSGNTDMWVTVVSTTDNVDYWTLTVSKESPTEDVDIYAGATLINYGQSGEGAIELIGGEPMIRMFTHTGTPYSSVDDFLVIGNLDGQFGVSGSELGFGVGDPLMLDDYFVATEDGIRMSGELRIGAIDYTTGVGFWAGKESSVSKFRVGDPAGDYIRWNGSTLEIRGSIAITGSSTGLDNFGIGDLAYQNNVTWEQVIGANKPEDNATAGATWNVDLAGIPSTLEDDGTIGLHLTSEFMGYYDGDEFTTYIDNDGGFYFKGSTGYIAWNPTSDKLFGHNGVEEQWYASSVDGKLYAGAGSVMLDSQGAKFIGYKSTLLFSNESDPNTPVGTVRLDNDGSADVLKIINGLDASDTNLITNGTFETNTTGWTIDGTGNTPARSSDVAHGGSYSIEFSPYILSWSNLQDESGVNLTDESGTAITVLNASTAIEDSITSNSISLTEGEDYLVQLYVYYPEKDYYTLELNLKFYNGADELVRTKVISFVDFTYDAWNLARDYFVAQTGETSVKVEIVVDQGYGTDDASPESIYVDDVAVYALSAYNAIIEVGNSYVNFEADAFEFDGPVTFVDFPTLPSSNPTSDYQPATKKYADDNFVGLSGNETIAGTKTFSTIPVLPSSDPTTDNQAVRKAYVDGKTSVKTVQVVVFGMATAVETGDNKGMLPITDVIDGWNLTKVEATCSVAPSGGPVTVQLSRFSGTENDMLSTALSITAGNNYASTTSINTSYDDVEAGWAILFDVDAANSAYGLFVTLTFEEA